MDNFVMTRVCSLFIGEIERFKSITRVISLLIFYLNIQIFWIFIEFSVLPPKRFDSSIH